MVYTKLGYAYWGIEGTEFSGEPGSDTQIPFNPFTSFTPPKPMYTQTVERTVDSLEPVIVYTNELTPGTTTISSYFRDPFLLLACFTHKTESGDWSATDGVLTGDFTDTDDEDSLFIQYRIEDDAGSAHLDRLLTGVKPTRYSWSVDAGGLLRENVSFRATDFADNTEAMSVSTDFHDGRWCSGAGGWADWSNTKKWQAQDMVVHWNDAVIDGLKIRNFEFAMDLASPTDRTFDSLAHNVQWLGDRNFTLTLTGRLLDLGELGEFESAYKDKTTNTIKVYYDDTTSYEKYLQFTVGYVSDHGIVAIDKSGNAAEVTITLSGGEDTAVSYSATYNKDTHVDPTALITLSP